MFIVNLRSATMSAAHDRRASAVLHCGTAADGDDSPNSAPARSPIARRVAVSRRPTMVSRAPDSLSVLLRLTTRLSGESNLETALGAVTDAALAAIKRYV
jgi:hypothetical protein